MYLKKQSNGTKLPLMDKVKKPNILYLHVNFFIILEIIDNKLYYRYQYNHIYLLEKNKHG